MYRGKLFSIHAFPNELGSVRLGLSVSRKVGNAVVRNKIRRRLREMFHAYRPGIRGDVDLVISARPSVADVSFSDLREEFERALKKLEGPIKLDEVQVMKGEKVS